MPKRSVSIIATKGRLQLRFRVHGQRHYLSLGLSDSPYNRKMAHYTATEIEKDIHFERLNPTLQKYKKAALSTTAIAEGQPEFIADAYFLQTILAPPRSDLG